MVAYGTDALVRFGMEASFTAAPAVVIWKKFSMMKLSASSLDLI